MAQQMTFKTPAEEAAFFETQEQLTQQLVHAFNAAQEERERAELISVNGDKLAEKLVRAEEENARRLKDSNTYYAAMMSQLFDFMGNATGMDTSNNVMQLQKAHDLANMPIRDFFGSGNVPTLVSACADRLSKGLIPKATTSAAAAGPSSSAAAAAAAAEVPPTQTNPLNQTIEKLMPDGPPAVANGGVSVNHAHSRAAAAPSKPTGQSLSDKFLRHSKGLIAELEDRSRVAMPLHANQMSVNSASAGQKRKEPEPVAEPKTMSPGEAWLASNKRLHMGESVYSNRLQISQDQMRTGSYVRSALARINTSA
jgi:hypothetical protein